ncbi:hypothetical protein ACF0H5_011613 [Mactra antiquata]
MESSLPIDYIFKLNKNMQRKFASFVLFGMGKCSRTSSSTFTIVVIHYECIWKQQRVSFSRKFSVNEGQ